MNDDICANFDMLNMFFYCCKFSRVVFLPSFLELSGAVGHLLEKVESERVKQQKNEKRKLFLKAWNI